MALPQIILSLLLSSSLAACSVMPGIMVEGESTERASKPDTFKVLTYNALHGLDVGRFWVRPGESSQQQDARFHLRIEQLAKVQPDIILLQEVNPLPQMAEDYVQALKAHRLEYSQVHQVDACGFHVPGLAMIPGLNNGLLILAKAPLRMRELEGLKLSGGPGWCHDFYGVQFGELRYALIAEVWRPDSEMRHLVVSTHLHSGVERDAYFLHDLMEAHQQGRVMHYDHLRAELIGDQERRLMELHHLVEALQHYQVDRRYAGLIVGGDFNFEPGSPEYVELNGLGWQDSAQLAAQMPMLNTYDPQRNPIAVHEEDKLPAELELAIADESPMDRDAIIARYRTSIRQARRIDFLFSMAFMPKACLMQNLFGEPTPDGLAGSDHYGVLNTYTYQMIKC